MKAKATESDSPLLGNVATNDAEGDTALLDPVRVGTSVPANAEGDGVETLGGVVPPADVGDIGSIESDEASLAVTQELTTPLSPRAAAQKRKPTFLTRIAEAVAHIGLDDRAGRVLLSILLAFLLWFYVVNLENPSQTTVFNDLPVEVRGLAKGLKLNNSVAPVDVTVQAPQNALTTLRPGDVRPFMDIAGLTAGVHTVPIRADLRNAQAGGAQISINPGNAQVQLEVEATREFPVQVQVAGTPAFGYGVDAAQSEPGNVRVTGAEDLVTRVSKLVVTVDVGEKAGTQRGSRQPTALDEGGNVIEGLAFEPAQVQVVVPIKLLLNYKVVGVRADTRGQPAPGYRVSAITTDPNTVTICCQPAVLNNIQFLDTLPVPMSGATFDVITRTELLLPQDVELYPGQSKAISVTVKVEPLVTTLQVSVAPIVEGQLEGIGIAVSPDRLDLTLSGTFGQLQGLKPTDVRAFLNVQGRGPGTYEIRPQVTVPQGVKLESAEPDTVTVTLLAPTAVPTSTPTLTPTPTPRSTALLQPSPVATTQGGNVEATPGVASPSANTPAAPTAETIGTPPP